MSRTDLEHLHDALLHFDIAVHYATEQPLDQKAIDAICMRIAAGVDALDGVSRELRDQLFGDTWPAMWGMRNRIAHTYALVEESVVVATVRKDLPELRARIEAHVQG